MTLLVVRALLVLMLVLHFVLMFWVVRGSCIVYVFQRIHKWRNGKLCRVKEERRRSLHEPTRVEPDFELVSSTIYLWLLKSVS